MGKIILFYKYIYLENPERVVQNQKELCHSLGLKGRLLIGHEGINGTLGGQADALDQYINFMRQDKYFSDIDFKFSPGGGQCFPRLQVKLKKEIVKFGVDPELIKAEDGGKHLKPNEAHELIAQKKELMIFDARNNYESRIGTFLNAVTPDIENFRDLPKYIDENLEQFKDKEVLMFCTGGIRCERATSYLKSKGVAKDVYQILGGIHRYVEEFPDGFFRGKNYVFDGRIAVKVNEDILGSCDICAIACDDYYNCVNAVCNKQIILCASCRDLTNYTCSDQCKSLIESNVVNVRAVQKKVKVDAESSK